MGKRLIGSLELDRIYQMDCIEGMRLLPDDSVDLIVIDPPYNIGKDKRWDKWRKVEDYVAWMTEVFRECERVLKSNGSFYWFHNDFPQIRKLMDAIDENTSFIFKQFITWSKIDESFHNYGYVQQRLSVDGMRNYYNGFTEYCLFYTFQDDTGLSKIFADKNCFASIKKYLDEELEKSGYTEQTIKNVLGNQMASHYFGFSKREKTQFSLPTESNYKKLQSTGYFTRPYESLRREYEQLREEYEKQRYTFHVAIVKDDLRANSNVWLYPPAEKLGHITPKPVELIENIIRHSSNEGAIVLDCFMGSGTTAVAALRNNRHFIGFERESEYIEIANKRLENVFDEIKDV
jgi:DNA modification methylase